MNMLMADVVDVCKPQFKKNKKNPNNKTKNHKKPFPVQSRLFFGDSDCTRIIQIYLMLVA